MYRNLKCDHSLESCCAVLYCGFGLSTVRSERVYSNQGKDGRLLKSLNEPNLPMFQSLLPAAEGLHDVQQPRIVTRGLYSLLRDNSFMHTHIFRNNLCKKRENVKIYFSLILFNEELNT